MFRKLFGFLRDPEPAATSRPRRKPFTIGREAHAMKRAFVFNVVRPNLAAFGNLVNPDAISEGQCDHAAVIRNGKVEGAE